MGQYVSEAGGRSRLNRARATDGELPSGAWTVGRNLYLAKDGAFPVEGGTATIEDD